MDMVDTLTVYLAEKSYATTNSNIQNKKRPKVSDHLALRKSNALKIFANLDLVWVFNLIDENSDIFSSANKA